MANSNGNGNGHAQTINQDGTTAQMPSRLQRHSIKGLREGYADVYDAVMNGTLHHKSAQEANRALTGGLNTFKTQADLMQKAQLGEEKLRKFVTDMMGITSDEPKKLEQDSKG